MHGWRWIAAAQANGCVSPRKSAEIARADSERGSEREQGESRCECAISHLACCSVLLQKDAWFPVPSVRSRREAGECCSENFTPHRPGQVVASLHQDEDLHGYPIPIEEGSSSNPLRFVVRTTSGCSPGRNERYGSGAASRSNLERIASDAGGVPASHPCHQDSHRSRYDGVCHNGLGRDEANPAVVGFGLRAKLLMPWSDG